MDSAKMHCSPVRRSCRPVKQSTRFSPPPKDVAANNRGRKRKKDAGIVKDCKRRDKSETDSPTCERCGNRYVVDPFRVGNVARRLAPKKTLDPITRRYLQMCYQCKLDLKRQQKSNKDTEDQRDALMREKEAYLREAKSFADSLVTSLGVTNAEKLYCPRFTSKPCRCIQTYLISGGRNENYRKRANFLLKLIKSAQRLSSEKCYDRNEVLAKKCRTKVGLGNGQKRSKAYEEFVMVTRHQLKTEHNLCEMAIKKVLCYSNNFLFKRLKSEQRGCRVEKVKGRGRKDGGLMSIEEIGKWKCCRSHCSMIAISHSLLLQEWRTRAAQGQSETRRVIAEMLTPSGMHTNCYQFIRQVLGVTSSVIGSVNQHMCETGGSREPPPHGLRAYWQEHPRRRRRGRDDSDDEVIQHERARLHRTGSFQDQSVDMSSGSDALRQTPEATVTHISHGNQGNGVPLSSDGEVIPGIITGENGPTVELVTCVNPDGSAQVIQVPVISCSSLVSDNIGQDVTLQLATESAHFPSDSTHLDLDSVSRPISTQAGTHLDSDILETVYVSHDSAMEMAQVTKELTLTPGIDGLLNKDAKQINKTDHYSIVVGVDGGNFCVDAPGEDLVFTNGHMMDRFNLGQGYSEGLHGKVVHVDGFVHPETNSGESSVSATEPAGLCAGEKPGEQPFIDHGGGDVIKSSKGISVVLKTSNDCPKLADKCGDSNSKRKDGKEEETSVNLEKTEPLIVVLDKDEHQVGVKEVCSKKTEGFENGPQTLIERAQQLIAESQRVVKKSTELAKQPLVQPSQITEQLQQLVGHSEKLVAQQHLTAVQLEQLTAAQSLQQLSSSMQHKKVPAHDVNSIAVSQPRMTAPIATSLQQQGLLTSLQPPAPKVTIPHTQTRIPTSTTVLGKRLSKKFQELTAAQLLPSVAKRTISKEVSKQREKKTAFILPKKPLNESSAAVSPAVTTTTTAISKTNILNGPNEPNRQLLVPVLGTGVALTVGMDNKGLPQLLVPCITTDKPETPHVLPNQLCNKGIPKVGAGSYASRSNTIILQHPNVNGGSFSVQHVSDNVGVCFHPNSSVPGYVNLQGYGVSTKDGVIPTMTSSSISMSQRRAMTVHHTDNVHKPLLSSDKQHLKELLPLFNETASNAKKQTNKS